MRQSQSSLLSCRRCKIRWILWMFQDNFKKLNQTTVSDCLTFPVNLQWFPMMSSDTRLLLGLQENVFGDQSSAFDSPRDHPQGVHSCKTQCEQGPVPQAAGTGTPHSQEMTNKMDAQFQCRLLQEGRRLWVRLLRWKFCRIPWLDSKDSKYRSCNPTHSLIHNHFWFGKYESKIKRLPVLISPSEAVSWIKKVDTVHSVEKLQSSRSVSGMNFPIIMNTGREDWCWVNKIIQNSNIKKKVGLEQQKAQKEDPFFRAKQISFMIYDNFRMTDAHDQVLNYAEVFVFHDAFFSNSIHFLQLNVNDSIWWYLGKSVQMENTCVGATQNSIEIVSCQFIRRYWCWINKKRKQLRWEAKEQKLRLQNFDVKQNRSSCQKMTRMSCVEKGKYIRYQWNEKKPSAATFSALNVTRSKCVEEMKYQRRKQPWCHSSTIVQIIFEGYLHAIALWILASPWVSILQNWNASQVGDECLSPHHKVDEPPKQKSQRKDTIPTKEEKAKTRMLWLLWNFTTIGLRLGRVGSIGVSHRKTVMKELVAKSQGTNSKNTIHSVYATSSKYPGKERTIAWNNTSQKSSSGKCPRSEIWGPVPWRDWNTTAMRPKQGMEPYQKHFGAKEKDRATFHSPAEEWVLPAASTKKLEEREFVVDSGASMHMDSKKDFNFAELESMRTSRSPTTVMEANGEVQTKKRSHGICKELDLFVTVVLLEESPAVLPLAKLCEDGGFTYHWTSGQKPHLTKSVKRIACKIKRCSIRSPFFFSGGMSERTPNQKSTKTEYACAQEKRASLKTSWTEGNIPGASNWTTVPAEKGWKRAWRCMQGWRSTFAPMRPQPDLANGR